MDLNNNSLFPVLEKTSIQSNQVSVIVFAPPHSSSFLNPTNSTKKKKIPATFDQPSHNNRVEIIVIDDDLDSDSNQTKLVPHAALPILPNQLEPQPPILSDSIIDYQKFDNGIEIITIDDSDDDDDNIETNIEETLKSISIQQKNYNSTSDKLIEVNQICGNDIVASEANVESLIPETSSISLDLGGDFELVDNQNNTKLTSKTDNNNRKQHREYYGLRKRRLEEEPRNSQASSELNRVKQNGKLRSNKDIDNRATSSGRRRSDGGFETSNQRECRSRQWKLLKITETPEQRERRLAQMREWRANETPEERERRLTLQREYDKQKLANETPEQRERRLTLQREYYKQRLANETPEQREIRLAKKLESYHRNKQKQQQHSFLNSKIKQQ